MKVTGVNLPPGILRLRAFSDWKVDPAELRVSGDGKAVEQVYTVTLPEQSPLYEPENPCPLLAEFTDAAVVAFPSIFLEEEAGRQYDAVISLYDSPADIIHKLRNAVSVPKDSPAAEGNELSAREKDILICVAKGLINKEIADLFNISIHTVISHRRNITRKTGIKTVAGLTVYALLNNLIDASSVE